MINGLRKPVFLKVMGIAAILALAYYLIFFLPYLFPPKNAVDSPSYCTGFNNLVAVIGTIFILLIFAALKIVRPSSPSTLDLFLTKGKQGVAARKSFLFWLCVIIYIFLTAFSFIVFDNPHYHGEEEVYVKGIDLLQRGEIPYRDFWLPFGPALVYIPFFLKIALKGFGISSRTSYYLFFGFMHLLSLYMLYYLVNKLNIEQKYRSLIFVALALLQNNVGSSLQYTFIRALPPYFFLFLIHGYYINNFKAKTALKTMGLLCLPAIFLLIVFSLFIEIGIAFFMTLMLYLFIFFLVFREKKIGVVFGLYGVFALLFALLIPPLYLRDLLAYVGGANNFPLFPSLPVLLFLFCLFYAVPYLFQSVYAKEKNDKPLYLGYALLCVFLVPGAFGRSDVGHVFFYGVGLFIVTAGILAGILRRAFKVFMSVFLAVFVFSFVLGLFACSGGKIAASLYARAGKFLFSEDEVVRFSARLGLNPEKTASVIKYEKTYSTNTYAALDKYPSLATPLPIDNNLYNYLLKKGKFVPDYFLYMQNIDTAEELKRKIDGLMPSDYLIVPKRESEAIMAPPGFSETAKTNTFFSMILLFPVKLIPKHPPFNSHKKLIDHILLYYQKIDEVGMYVVYKKRGFSK